MFMTLVQLAFCSKHPHWQVCPTSRDARDDPRRALSLSWAGPVPRLCCIQAWRSECVLSSWGPSSDRQLPAHCLLPTCFTWDFGRILAVGIADMWPVPPWTRLLLFVLRPLSLQRHLCLRVKHAGSDVRSLRSPGRDWTSAIRRLPALYAPSSR